MDEERLGGRQLLFKGRVGSHLYGTSTPESDEDFIGIFMPTAEDLLGINRTEEFDLSTKNSGDQRRNTEDDTDCKYYSIQKFIRLLLQNNPNIVEIPFINEENIIFCHPEIKRLFEEYPRFISQRVYKSFGGYAYSQRTKMVVKKERYEGITQAIDWMENFFDLKDVLSVKGPVPISEEAATILNKKIKYYKGEKDNTEHFHSGLDLKMLYEKIKAERDRYGWRVKTDSFEKVGYDVKFGYHLIRLMIEGNQLMQEGKLTFPLDDHTLAVINSIRNCHLTYEELLKTYDAANRKLDALYAITPLRKNPDRKWAEKWLVKFQLDSLKYANNFKISHS